MKINNLPEVPNAPKARGVTLAPSDQEFIRDHLAQYDTHRITAATGIQFRAILRAACGLPVSAGVAGTLKELLK